MIHKSRLNNPTRCPVCSNKNYGHHQWYRGFICCRPECGVRYAVWPWAAKHFRPVVCPAAHGWEIK